MDEITHHPAQGDPGDDVDCERAIVEIYEYLDGELTTSKRRAIARHLDDCPPCAQGFTFEFELRQVISMKCRDRVPAELRQRIAEALRIDVPPA
ncbi:MAG TPA: mycothiol system anti-sigma-R factor [Acidimicrobiia bacterium]|nr:mycothiol system anti-sigma-R factor [Acidimicrobiia bacterium]